MPPIEELENEERQDIVTHLQNILNQLDITLSALKATGTETPRTLSNVYDQITSILSQFDLTLTSLRDAIVNGTTPTDLLDISNQLQKLINALVSVATDSLRIKILTSDIQVPSDLQSVLAKKVESYAADETVAQSVGLTIGGFKQVEVLCHATAATTFTVEYSFDNTHFYTYYSSPNTETDYSAVFWTAAQYVKVSAAAAGVAGDTVDLVIGAKP